MDKVDFKKELKHLYKPSHKEVSLIDVPPMNYLMIDGKGDPDTTRTFQEAVEVLYAFAYALKFMVKKGSKQIDYGVLPLEGLWWAEDMSAFVAGKKDDWFWTLMIMQPDFISATMVDEAREQVRKKKQLTALSQVRFTALSEGTVAQTMHVGPFTEEGPTVEKVHRFIEAEGLLRRGKHHEIYLSDIRRTAPDKWRTVIRQPVE